MNNPGDQLILISYRRNDSAGATGRMVDSLKRVIDKKHFFRDIENIGGGEKFPAILKKSITDCDVFIAVIGPGWLSKLNRNLTNEPVDYVRLEISIALKKRKQIIPVLVDGANMPSASELPEDIRNIVEYNAEILADRSWEYDIDKLVKNLLSKGITLSKTQKPDNGVTFTLSTLIWGSLLIAGLIFLYFYFIHPTPDTKPSTTTDSSLTPMLRNQSKAGPVNVEGQWVVPGGSKEYYYNITQNNHQLVVETYNNNVRETIANGYVSGREITIHLQEASGMVTVKAKLSSDGQKLLGTRSLNLKIGGQQAATSFLAERKQ